MVGLGSAIGALAAQTSEPGDADVREPALRRRYGQPQVISVSARVIRRTVVSIAIVRKTKLRVFQKTKPHLIHHRGFRRPDPDDPARLSAEMVVCQPERRRGGSGVVDISI